MSVSIHLPDDLVAEIDTVSKDRSTFVAAAVRRALREQSSTEPAEEVARINSAADELNREAADVLEYQVVR